MFEFKIQVACIVAVFYIIFVYAKGIQQTKVKPNNYYLALITLAPFAIIFDGATAWTVNRMDIVPDWLNLTLHLLFLLMMNSVLVVMFLYTLIQTVGHFKAKSIALFAIPGILADIGIISFINKLYYIQGKRTWYSMGLSVYVCFGSLIIHVCLIAIVLASHWRNIEKKKRAAILGLYGILLVILIVQIILPETLISAMMPMIGVLGSYICFEDPSIRKMENYNQEMVKAFATLVENRDDSTGNHIIRTKEYVRILLREMGKETKYHSILSADYIKNVLKAAPMHDIGKISTPDSILKKPGRLTEEEFSIMKQHAPIGGEIIKETFSAMDSPESIKIAYEIARYHHEKWNGKGYPEGLKEDEIPLHARIMAIADVFDAVSEKRCYRDAMPLEECFAIIENGAGTDFDPTLVSLFLRAKQDVLNYHNETNERL